MEKGKLTLQELRKKHPLFSYRAFKTEEQKNSLLITFDFLLHPDIVFQPTLLIPYQRSLPAPVINNFVFHLGLIEMLSYWKAACSPQLVISAAPLSAAQLPWWHDLFIQGMGEFYFRNQIDFSSPDFLQLHVDKAAEEISVAQLKNKEQGILVLASGGKDSALALELLSFLPEKKAAFMVNPIRAANDSINIAGVKESFTVTRTLDPKLLELNAAGYLNGHTPFSALLAFVSSFCAALNGYSEIIAANESSANEPNTVYFGQKINHQYSKSYTFEAKFREYLNRFIAPELNYFSLLRPLNELQISRLFCQLPQHFISFRSCNVTQTRSSQKKDTWCLDCPKCTFVYLSLFPFLTTHELQSIFGKELFTQAEDENSLRKHLRELLGLDACKPFECVGTQQDSAAALALAIAKLENQGETVPRLLTELNTELKEKELSCLNPEEHLKQWNQHHFLPPHYQTLLQQAPGEISHTTCEKSHLDGREKDSILNRRNKQSGGLFQERPLPVGAGFKPALINEGHNGNSSYQRHQDPLIGADSLLILGYGREGRGLHQFLAEHYPKLKIAIADRNPIQDLAYGTTFNIAVFTGPDYLDTLKDYHYIARSPGISPHLPEIREAKLAGKYFTSLTDLFMRRAPGRKIGITGTKGKSTTSALITHLLSAKLSDVRLVGNIGTPSITALKDSSQDTVFVIEFSSFQLEDLTQSPNYAVMLGTYEEHLDHHLTFANYLQAKSNLGRYQTVKDFFIYNPDAPFSAEVATQSNAAKIHFGSSSLLGAVTFIREGIITLVNRDKKESRLLEVAKLPLLGPGNIENVLAAIATAQLFQLSPEEITHGLITFQPLKHRLQKLGVYRGIQFVDDSLSTIPQAAINALDALGSTVETIIVGGQNRGISFQPLAEALLRPHLKTVILFPETGDIIWNEVKQLSAQLSCQLPQAFKVNSMEEAVKIAYAHTTLGKTCLLSPASPSFNIFRDYEDRAAQFEYWIKRINDDLD